MHIACIGRGRFGTVCATNSPFRKKFATRRTDVSYVNFVKTVILWKTFLKPCLKWNLLSKVFKMTNLENMQYALHFLQL